MEWTLRWWRISIHRIYPTPEQLSCTYNRAASWWQQQLHWLGYDHAYIGLFRSLQQQGILAHLQDNSAICDCGIGTGALSLAIAQTVSSEVQISGVDISPAMLKKSAQLLTGANVNHDLCQSDATALPFKDNSFDLVMSAHMLEHLLNPAEGLREMLRVLRPGAPLILAVTRSNWLGWLIEWYWGNTCFTQQQLIDLMTKAGLINVQFYPFKIGLARWTSIACLGFKL
jgi:ubiquinone/menaquinone biosynthesis C-methylase UbiE